MKVNEVQYDTPTPRWSPLCFLTEGFVVLINMHHPHILPTMMLLTTTETYKTFTASESIFRNTNTHMPSCHWALQTINSSTADAASCWSKVKGQRSYPSTMSSPYLTGTLVDDVEMFSWSGENMDAVCVGEGGPSRSPVWTQHNHTHSALSSVSSSSPSSSSSSLQLRKTEKEYL